MPRKPASDDLDSLLDEAVASAGQAGRGYFDKEPVKGWLVRFLEKRSNHPELTLLTGYEVIKKLAREQGIPGKYPTKSTFEAAVRRIQERG